MKYALRRIHKGEYIILSDDAKTLWRIRRYMDGPSAGIERNAYWTRDRWFWCADRWKSVNLPHELTEDDLGDEAKWSADIYEYHEKRADVLAEIRRRGKA